MAYHYVFEKATGTARTIRTESLPTYQASGLFAIFDTAEERDAALPPTWWAINYGLRRTPAQITPAQAEAYWQATHLQAGWALFTSYADAQAALAAMPPRYSVSDYSGEVAIIRDWLPESERGREGFRGAYATREAAEASRPPRLCCLNYEGGKDYCWPANKQRMERDGYIVRATWPECEAAMPRRYILDGQRYRRATTGRVMRNPSRFAALRGAIQHMRRNEPDAGEYYRVAGPRGAEDLTVTATLVSVASNVAQFHSPDRYDFSTAYNRTAATEFAARVNKMVGRDVLGLCGDCHMAVTMPGSRMFEGRTICANCSNNYHTCTRSGCGRLMHDTDSREDSRGNIVCRDHWTPVLMDVGGGMLSYSTDVTRRLDGFRVAKGEKADPKKTLWLGWELECHAKGAEGESGSRMVFDEDCSDCGGSGEYEDEDGDNVNCSCGVRSGNRARAVERIAEAARDWCIVKEDGSLDNGMEIVSVPASLRWHRENVAPFLEGAKEYLSGWAHNDCGIHVHVGRKQLSELQQSKLVRFMHEPRNQSFITRVAGRDPNSYCNRGGVKAFGAFKTEARIGRYQALNFATRNKKTIEFRIFRSNVSPAGFIKNLEFVHALCMWARFASAGDVASGSLVEYVKRERGAYNVLAKWFESQGMLPAPSKPHPDAVIPAYTIAA